MFVSVYSWNGFCAYSYIQSCSLCVPMKAFCLWLHLKRLSVLTSKSKSYSMLLRMTISFFLCPELQIVYFYAHGYVQSRSISVPMDDFSLWPYSKSTFVYLKRVSVLTSKSDSLFIKLCLQFSTWCLMKEVKKFEILKYAVRDSIVHNWDVFMRLRICSKIRFSYRCITETCFCAYSYIQSYSLCNPMKAFCLRLHPKWTFASSRKL